MSEQSRLENIGITKREELVIKNDYADETVGREYNENHEDAKSDGDPQGKGTGVSMGFAVAKPEDFSVSKDGVRTQKMSYGNLITHESESQTVGGSYDRNGRGGLKYSGRLQLQGMNKYNPENEYGVNSVDTTANLLLGQYKVQ